MVRICLRRRITVKEIMSFTFKELMDKLGVPKLIGAYETYPWSTYDEELDGGTTCSAEVRMGAEDDDIEAEIQIVRDAPTDDSLMMEQICLIRGHLKGDNEWDIHDFWLNAKPHDKEIYDWQGKSCNFFRAVVQDISMNKMPDFDRLIARELHDRGGGGDNNRGSGGGKKPKVRGESLMGMKKGGGGF